MTQDDFAAFMDAAYKSKISALRKAGQHEYAGGKDADAFGNFKRLSAAMGLTPEQVLLVYMTKHVDGIHAWARGHKSQREPVQGRICDLIVYGFLLLGLIEEGAGE